MSVSEQATATNHSSDTERASELNLDFHIKSHGALFFLISMLVNFLQIKFQSTNDSPFDKHRSIMLTFIVTILIYVISLVVEISLLRAQNSTNYTSISKVNLLVGVLAAILLLLILAPFVGWTIFAIWVPCFVIITHDSCRELCTWLYQAKVLGRGSMEEQNQSPAKEVDDVLNC